MPSKEIYYLVGEDLRDQLNFILSRISDRLDQIEGNRGTSTIQDGITIKNSDNIIHGFNTSDET